MKVVRVLVYEYDSEERAKVDQEHWNVPPNCTYNPTPSLTITSKVIEDGDEHFISIADHAWSMQHSVLCRPNLLDCAFHAEAVLMSEADAFEEVPEGKYKMVPTGGYYMLEEI